MPRRLCTLIIVLCVMPSTDMLSAEPAGAEHIARLIEQLDADQYAQREAAERELREAGPAALPQILQAIDSPSPEARVRAARLLDRVHYAELLRQFSQFKRFNGPGPAEEQALFLTAKILDPLLARTEMTQRVDALAAKVRAQFTVRNIDPKSNRPAALDTLIEVLFVQEGFRGNEADFDNPENSSIIRVMETRQGLPITLSQLMIAVGRRVDVPLAGLATPGRYMVKYAPPPGEAHHERIIDPFLGGRSYTLDELEDVLAGLGAGFDPMTHLEPDSAEAMLARMLRNLASDLREARRHALASRVDDFYHVIAGEP